jgi:hypothetical protein
MARAPQPPTLTRHAEHHGEQAAALRPRLLGAARPEKFGTGSRRLVRPVGWYDDGYLPCVKGGSGMGIRDGRAGPPPSLRSLRYRAAVRGGPRRGS